MVYLYKSKIYLNQSFTLRMDHVKKSHIECKIVLTSVYKQVTVITLQVGFVRISYVHTYF
jgi:hypothetical protein